MNFNGQNTVLQGDTVIITKECTVTKETYTIRISLEDYNTWRNGALIMEVFPQLSADQREFIITGYTPAEWDNLWKDSE